MMVGVFLILWLSVITNDVNGFLWGSKKTMVVTDEQAKEIMLSGTGGVAIIDVGLEDMVMVIKNKTYTCRDLQIKGSIATCPSGYDNFEHRNTRDICYALRYSVVEEMTGISYCISPNYEEVELKKEKDCIVCKSNSKTLNATLINEDNFYRMCRRRISDPIKVQFFAKNRESMPVSESMECNHYTCEFMTYRKVDKILHMVSFGSGIIHNNNPYLHHPSNHNEYPVNMFNDDVGNNQNNNDSLTETNTKDVDTDRISLLDVDDDDVLKKTHTDPALDTVENDHVVRKGFADFNSDGVTQNEDVNMEQSDKASK